MIQDPNERFLHRSRLTILGIAIVLPVLFLIYKFTHPTLPSSQKVSANTNTKSSTLGLETVEIDKMISLSGTTRDIVINRQGNLAYVAAYGQGIHILNLGTPLNPERLSSFKYNPKYDAVTKLALSKDEKKLYALDEKKGVYSLNIQDPSNPKLIDFVTLVGGNNITLSQNGKHIYISGTFGVGIIDINKDNTFKLLGRLHYLPDAKRYVISKYLPHLQYAVFENVADVVEVNTNTLYIMNGHPDIVSINNLTDIKILSSFSTLGHVKQVTLSDNRQRMYLASGDSGIEIFDIADYQKPKPLGGHNIEGSAEHTIISREKNILYISTFNSGLQLYDITYPYDPKLIKKVDIKKGIKRGHAIGSALSADEKVLYIAYGVSGLGVLQTK